MASNSTDWEGETQTERVLWKIVRAATALNSATNHWQQCQRRSASVQRHIRRCTTVTSVMLKASSYAVTLGSAAKVVGGVATAAGVVSRVSALTGLGCRVWRMGCTAKLAGLSGRILTEIWERGFKDALKSYLASLGGFLQSMSLFRTMLEEVEVLMPPVSDSFTTGRFMPLLLLVCPEELFPYACHVVRLFVSPQQYSAVYDFATMAANTFDSSVSLPMKALHEMESFHAMTVLNSLPVPLQIASTALHVGREVVDLAANLNNPTNTNSDFQTVGKVLRKLKTVLVSLASSVKGVPLLQNPVLAETAREQQPDVNRQAPQQAET